VTILKKSAQFGGYSLLGGGLSAILLLPTTAALKLSSAAGDVMPKDIVQYNDLFDYISRHFTMAEPNIRDGMPNMYCGIIVLILLPVYFLSRKISTKSKVMNAVLLIILILSFNVNILNFLWHGKHYPNQLNHRFAFVYIFMVLSMCYPAFTRLREFSEKQLGAICSVVFLLIILSQKLNDKPPKDIVLYVSMLFIIVYAAALTFHKSRKVKRRRILLAITLAMIFELAAGTIGGIWQVDEKEGYTTRSGYSSGEEVRQIRDSIKELKKINSEFFRMEVFPPRTTNDPFLYNYNGLSIFSSTFQEKPVKMFQNLGYHSNGINSYKYEGSTILMDSLFGIKYLLYRDQGIHEKLYKEIKNTNDIWVYENPYVTSIGFHAGNDIKEWDSGWSDPFDAQNKLFRQLTGIHSVLTPVDQEHMEQENLSFNSNSGNIYYSFTRYEQGAESKAKIKINVEKDQQLYIYIDPPINDISGSLAIVGDRSFWFNGTRSTVVNLGYCTAGMTVEIHLTFKSDSPSSGRFTLAAMGLDLPQFEEGMRIIKAKSFQPESISDTRVTGSVKAPEDGYMIMTVPYDKGWTVFVDGEKTETEVLDNSLLSFKMPHGTHKIEMRFIPDKFIPGLIITGVSLLVLIILIFFTVRKRRLTR
ncbi:MAG: YfhO family protein, partial [Eubacteriales bacterium]|nr:YfhO family protein [Eubacteriales bacterium]